MWEIIRCFSLFGFLFQTECAFPALVDRLRWCKERAVRVLFSCLSFWLQVAPSLWFRRHTYQRTPTQNGQSRGQIAGTGACGLWRRRLRAAKCRGWRGCNFHSHSRLASILLPLYCSSSNAVRTSAASLFICLLPNPSAALAAPAAVSFHPPLSLLFWPLLHHPNHFFLRLA
jgi:hypothetical protein